MLDKIQFESFFSKNMIHYYRFTIYMEILKNYLFVIK